MKIDIVYTWCTNTPEFLERKSEYSGVSDKNSNHEARFRDHDELKYSLRSVRKYLPWVNHIYILTDNQTPAYLNLEHPDVTIVSHQDTFQDTAYPNFSATAIEWNLDLIPNLSEHFIYFNDDVFIGKPLAPDYFFSEEKQPIWTLLKTSGNFVKRKYNDPTMASFSNSYLKAQKETGMLPKWKPDHAPMPMTLSQFKTLKSLFEIEVKNSCCNRFRKSSDIVLSRIYPAYFLGKKEISIHKTYGWHRFNQHNIKIHNLKTDKLTEKLTLRAIDKIKNEKVATFAINDTESTTERTKQNWARRLNELFPNPCDLETPFQ